MGQMNVIDIFAGGVGGWAVGLARAGYRTVAACEIDEWRRAVFAASHPGCRMYADVRELTAERLRADLGYLPDVVVGSPPCQEISTANCKGTGITDDHLFWEWARIVFEVRPLWCAAENSPNARLSGIDGILDALDQAGYAAWPLVVGADHAGANHRRRRLWLIAADARRAELWRHGADSAGLRRWQFASAAAQERSADERPGNEGQLLGKSERYGLFPADANRAELWQQPGRSGGTNGRCAAVAGEHVAHAESAERRPRSSPEFGMAGQYAVPQRQESPGGDAAHPDREGLAVGPRLGRHDGEELPAALRDIGLSWPAWNSGLASLAAACAAAGFGHVDDGNGRGLPANLRNRAIAALGDAVVPAIPEMIGRAMKAMIHGPQESP